MADVGTSYLFAFQCNNGNKTMKQEGRWNSGGDELEQ